LRFSVKVISDEIEKLYKPFENKFIGRRRLRLISSSVIYQFFQYERRTTYFTKKFAKLKTHKKQMLLESGNLMHLYGLVLF